MTLETTENFSFPPFKIIFMASSGIVSMASVNLKSYFWAIISNCLKIQEALYSPRGIKPPLLIEIFGFGIILDKLISFITPSPLQLGQAPFGELNEKLLGSGFG